MMDFLSENPNKIWKLKNVVLSKVNIVELIKESGVILEPKEAGEFDFRGFCPFHRGKSGGTERTPSFFVSSSTASFCCFGCSKSGNIIDFLSYINGSPPHIVLEQLAKKIGIMDKNGNYDELQFVEPVLEPVKTIEPFLFEISSLLREYIKPFVNTDNFNEALEWMEKLAFKIDNYLSKVNYEDWECVKELCEKIKKILKEKV